MAQPWLARSLLGPWTLMKRDPVGILLPAGGVLVLQAVLVVMLRRALWAGPPVELVAVVVAAIVLRFAIGTPLRAMSLAAGLRASGERASVASRLPVLIFIEVTTTAIRALAACLVAIVPTWLALGALSRGAPEAAAVVVLVGVVVALLVDTLVRAVWAYAPIEAVAGSGNPFRALGTGLGRAVRDPHGAVLATVTGDVLFALGSLVCVGALASWPWTDLTLVHRWSGLRAEVAK